MSAYKGRHDDENQNISEAYDKWRGDKPEREGLIGTFAMGWTDAQSRRSDVIRRTIPADIRRAAYMAGRSYYHQAQWNAAS